MTTEHQGQARVVEGRLRDVVDEIEWDHKHTVLLLAKVAISVAGALHNKKLYETTVDLIESLTGRLMIVIYPDGEREYHTRHDL